MKLYIWRDIGTLGYDTSLLVVAADNLVQARDLARHKLTLEGSLGSSFVMDTPERQAYEVISVIEPEVIDTPNAVWLYWSE